jgi:hypothetical protein
MGSHSAGLFLLYARSTKEPIMSAFVLASQWFFGEIGLSGAFSALLLSEQKSHRNAVKQCRMWTGAMI